MEYANKINHNSFELSSKTDSYLLGIWYSDEKIRIVVIKNNEKYERLYSNEKLSSKQPITQEFVNQLKGIIESNPEKVEISMINKQITVKIKEDNESCIVFEDIPVILNQTTTHEKHQQSQNYSINSSIEKKKDEEIDPQTLNMLCEYLNKLNKTISTMEKRLDILSNHVALIDKTNDSIIPNSSIDNIMANAATLEKKLEDVEAKISKFE